MDSLTRWINRHDGLKLALLVLAMVPVMLVAIGASDNLDPLMGIWLLGVALCAAGGYWLGNWKWVLIPLLAMLVEIALAIPASLRDPNALETPLSIVLEAPFWTGIPALLGAAIGYGLSRARI